MNGGSALLLAAGYLFIRSGRVNAHRTCMISALALSTAFLTGYLTYHYHAGHVPYHGPARPLYLAILLTHTILAVVNLPLILRTVYLAASGRFEEHKRLARWTLPSWMYVSVTGVIVYLMLYPLSPTGA